jgi:hypothetical protein
MEQKTKSNRKTTVVKRIVNAEKKAVRTVQDAPVRIYDHIIGERFSHQHKMNVGFILIIIGVGISMGTHEIHAGHIIAFFGDSVGYMIHGAGCTPFLEYLHYKVLNSDDENKKVN